MGVVNFKVSLKEVERMERWLKRKEDALGDFNIRLHRTLAADASALLESKIDAIPNLDGNDRPLVVVEYLNNQTLIKMIGDGAAFLEYGTGIVGKSSPHPEAADNGWVYDVNSRYKNKDRSWFYKRDNQLVRTSGIVGSRVLYNTFQEIQDELETLAKELWCENDN